MSSPWRGEFPPNLLSNNWIVRQTLGEVRVGGNGCKTNLGEVRVGGYSFILSSIKNLLTSLSFYNVCQSANYLVCSILGLNKGYCILLVMFCLGWRV